MAIIHSININSAQIAVNRGDSTSTPSVRQPASDVKSDSPKNASLSQSKLWDMHLALGQRQAVNLSLNKAAISVRTADKAMKTISTHIGSMKSQLSAIVKHYPPYLSSSPERIKALKAFNAFRREIEALTVPTQDRNAAKIMADPAVLSEAGNQVIAVGNGETGTIQSQQVHTGPTGLNIPALSDTATDAEINTAINNLDAAQATLGQRQAGLSMNWDVLVPSGKYADTVAEQASVELGKAITQNTWQGFTDIRPMLTQLA